MADQLAKPVAEAVAALATEAGQQPTLHELGERFVRAQQARYFADQAVKKAQEACSATIGEVKAANDAFGEALAEKAGLADVYEGKATVLLNSCLFSVTKSTREFGGGDPRYYVEMMPVVIVE